MKRLPFGASLHLGSGTFLKAAALPLRNMATSTRYFRPNFFGFIVRAVLTYAIVLISALFLFNLEKPNDLNHLILLVLLLGLPFLILNWVVIRASLKEVHFIRFNQDRMYFLTFPYFFLRRVSKPDIIGFSRSEVAYLRGTGTLMTDPVKMIIVYFANGTKIHLTTYNFKQLFRVVQGLRKQNIKYLGVEKNPYFRGNMFFPRYRYDQK